MQAALRQRSDYTHKPNLKTGRHGWLRLTPAYSVRIVDELIAETEGPHRVFDPFCGTATTALCAAYHGYSASTTDINPFLVWLGKAKTATYLPQDIARTRDACAEILTTLDRVQPAPLPPLHNIERWWPAPALDFLRRLNAALETIPAGSVEGTLLRVAFCRTLMASSNAAFNHQSMSFKDDLQLKLDLEPCYAEMFGRDVDFVVSGASDNPTGLAEVMLCDARELSSLRVGQFTLAITSPPYANRMSYIRELRPYMYWLGFLDTGRAAGDLDWQAIGGTWGIATSRLAEWKPEATAYTSEELDAVLARIAQPKNPNGALLAAYVRKYCTDMAEHFREVRAVLAPGGRLHYIVGNSTFYGELLSVERIYANMMTSVGFTEIKIRPLRKRNSKKELLEFDVSAMWPS